MIGSILGSVASSVVSIGIKSALGGKKRRRGGGSAPFAPDLDDFGSVDLMELRASRQESEAAPVFPVMDWTKTIMSIKPDELDKQLKDM